MSKSKKHAKMKLTSRSFPEFTSPGNLFAYNKATKKWSHVASGVLTINFVLSLDQAMDLVFAGTSHKKTRHDRREHIDRQYDVPSTSKLRPLERSPGAWAFKAQRMDSYLAEGEDEDAVIAVNFDNMGDSEKFKRHFDALRKQLSYVTRTHTQLRVEGRFL